MICETATEIVGTAREVSPEDMRGPIKLRPMAHARQEAMWVIRRASKQSLPQIGRYFRRDHTTVLYALRAVDGRMAANEEYRVEIEEMLSATLAKKGPEFYRHEALRPVFRTRRLA